MVGCVELGRRDAPRHVHHVTKEETAAPRLPTMTGTAFLVLLVRAVLAAAACAALPWLRGEARYASLEPDGMRVVTAAPELPTAFAPRNATHGPAEAVQRILRFLNAPSALFCVAMEESMVLFALVLLENAHARVATLQAHWRVSLPVVVLLITLGLPLAACLLLCYGGARGRWMTTRGVATMVLFAVWCLAFVRVPLPSTVTPATSGMFGALLARTGMLGTALIGALSGSAAGGAMCDSYELLILQRRRRSELHDVAHVQSSFQRTCADLASRRIDASALQAEVDAAGPRSGWSRLWSRSSKDRELSAVQTEIIGLEAMAQTLRTELEFLQIHERRARRVSTPLGRVILIGSYVFSFYCVWRVIQCVLNLVVFGYARSATQDMVSTCVLYALRLLGVHADVGAWSPRISFLFAGGLVAMRMRVILSSLSALVRSVSAGISTQLLVLFSAQVLCIFALAALIQLHVGAADSAQKSALLASLPEFQRVFGWAFDAVFLLSAALTGAYRWVLWQSEAVM